VQTISATEEATWRLNGLNLAILRAQRRVRAAALKTHQLCKEHGSRFCFVSLFSGQDDVKGRPLESKLSLFVPHCETPCGKVVVYGTHRCSSGETTPY
jgi:hypothetical protein